MSKIQNILKHISVEAESVSEMSSPSTKKEEGGDGSDEGGEGSNEESGEKKPQSSSRVTDAIRYTISVTDVIIDI